MMNLIRKRNELQQGTVDKQFKKSLSQGNLSQLTQLTATTSSSASEEELKLPQHLNHDVNLMFDEHSLGSASQDSVSLDGIPREIVVFHDKAEEESLSDFVDIYSKLESLKLMATSYKTRIASNEHLLDSLEEELRRTQQYAQDLTDERNTLLQSIDHMEEANLARNEQSSLLRMMLCFALFLYLCGGSEQFLIISVGVYLTVEAIASIV